ncbi:MAG TPA: peptidoglycan DD-metalloendopeptidase family protein [Vicinamibacterales bacterium]|nr:peptidoglycan DD-metalloendopeptidase family protein [Vicinamibacterales bacterium]
MPTLLWVGSRGADQAQVDALVAANESLQIENQSYRQATGELTQQIESIQTAMTTLGEQAQLDPATKRALEQLQRTGKMLAIGGPGPTDLAAKPVISTTPESTFGILRGLLGSLASRLESVKTRIETQQAQGRAVPSIWPLVGRYSSPFGNRADPFTGQPDFHPGMDISADQGVPVHATADGVVETAAYDGGYGNAILLGHGFGISTRYGHLSQFAVRPGQTVKRGDVIGYVGATGRVTGAHLHYEVLLGGQRINPLSLLSR